MKRQGAGGSYPSNGTSRCGGVGVERGQHGPDRGIQSRSAVKSEPTEPDQDGSEEDQGRVVRLAVALVLGVLLALAKHQGISKS